MYGFGFSCIPSCLYLCNQGGVFWVQMCPAARTQWTTPLKQNLRVFIQINHLIIRV